MKTRFVNHMTLFSAVGAIVLALTGVAHAGAVAQPSQKAQKMQKARNGTLNITSVIDVGGVTLDPGEYQVKQMNSAAGPVVRFTRYTYNPYAQEGLPVHAWDTVAEVKVVLQPLAAKGERTELLVDANSGKPVGLRIRGNSFDYLFASA